MARKKIASDAQLKRVFAEIDALLVREGLGGFFAISNPNLTEFRMILPDWSLAKYEGKGVRIRARTIDRNEIHETVGFLINTREACTLGAESLQQIAVALAQQFDLQHDTFPNLNPTLPPPPFKH
jgi:hypothetical protein